MGWDAATSKTYLETTYTVAIRTELLQYIDSLTYAYLVGQSEPWTPQFCDAPLRWAFMEFDQMIPSGTSPSELISRYNKGVNNGLALGLLIRK